MKSPRRANGSNLNMLTVQLILMTSLAKCDHVFYKYFVVGRSVRVVTSRAPEALDRSVHVFTTFFVLMALITQLWNRLKQIFWIVR